MTRTRRPLAALVLLAVIGAGCANARSETATGKGGGHQSLTKRDKAVRFAECMRDNGVSGFPDPDASGALTLDGVLNGSSLDADSTEWKQAIAACKHLQPAGFTGHKRNAQEQSAALRFAQCIRDHGVRDFPDPIAGEPLVDTNRIPSANQPGGMDILNAAMRKCGDDAAAAIGSR